MSSNGTRAQRPYSRRMPRSWNDIRTEAARFAARWADEKRENAEAQSFWNELLAVYDVDRKKFASFEQPVEGLATKSGRGRVDMLWPGLFMAEHKTRGEDLEAATTQAMEYVEVLEEHQQPQWVAISDFETVRLHEVETGKAVQFPLIEFPQRVELFGFLIGRQLRHQAPSDPVNVKAAEQMANLHKLLSTSGYKDHQLRVLLVRILFLLFGDDTGLWDERGLFYDLLADRTAKDGHNVGTVIGELFDVLATKREDRQTTLPDHLMVFPYVNGDLFNETIRTARFTPEMRNMLLQASKLDWGQVSPAIFGSMFQGVMDPITRRHLGAHYTSEANILKALGPLFLDDLKAQREKARGDRRKLEALLALLPTLRFLDPACGSGNFLLLTYRELRRLELDIQVELHKGLQALDVQSLLRVNVGQFFGIEIDEFAAQIARVAMWLTDHQMNIEASHQLGQNFVNLPLTQSAHILHGDALNADWAAHVGIETDMDARGFYITGNPPFVGGKKMTADQRAAVVKEFPGVRDAGVLDFVAAWYVKAARLQHRLQTVRPKLEVGTALVSTNSVTQGEQVAPLWTAVLETYGQVITAAHRTFKWSNDARRKAAVHCVIVTFRPAAQVTGVPRRLFSYPTPTSAPSEDRTANITPYLTDGPTVIVHKARKPIVSGTLPMHFGNMPLDGGNLLLTPAERDELLKVEKDAAPFIKPLLDAEDFISGETRYCLWLADAEPAELAKLKHVLARVEATRQWRLSRDRPQTLKKANTPTLFGEDRHPRSGNYLAIPGFSTERRDYVPIAYLTSETVVNNKLYMVPDADLLHFGVMQSRLHMDWMRLVGGRLKSDYSYTKEIVYNTFPWIEASAIKPKQRAAIEQAAQAVLDARAAHPKSTLENLYDPLLMPADLRHAHDTLDRAVESAYGVKAKTTEAQRTAFLLTRYQATAPTLTPVKSKRKKS